MKAIRQDMYGSTFWNSATSTGPPQVTTRCSCECAPPVWIRAWILMTGRPYLMRVMGYGPRRPEVAVRGRDLGSFAVQIATASEPGRDGPGQ